MYRTRPSTPRHIPDPAARRERPAATETTRDNQPRWLVVTHQCHPLNPIESALTDLLILKDFIPLRIRSYEKPGGASHAFRPLFRSKVDVNSLPRERHLCPQHS